MQTADRMRIPWRLPWSATKRHSSWCDRFSSGFCLKIWAERMWSSDWLYLFVSSTFKCFSCSFCQEIPHSFLFSPVQADFVKGSHGSKTEEFRNHWPHVQLDTSSCHEKKVKGASGSGSGTTATKARVSSWISYLLVHIDGVMASDSFFRTHGPMVSPQEEKKVEEEPVPEPSSKGRRVPKKRYRPRQHPCPAVEDAAFVALRARTTTARGAQLWFCGCWEFFGSSNFTVKVLFF